MPRCRNTRPSNAMGNFDLNGDTPQHHSKQSYADHVEKHRTPNVSARPSHPWPTPSPSPPPAGQGERTASLPSLADIPIVQQKRKHISTMSTGSDPTHIPRPRNAFILYRSSIAAQTRTRDLARARGGTAQQDVLSREAGRMWREESDGVRRHFEKLAQEEKRRHALMYPEYRYAPKKLGGVPVSVSAATRTRDSTSRSAAKDERLRAARAPATPTSPSRPSTRRSNQEPKVAALPSPLPSPTAVRPKAITIDSDSDDELEYEFEEDDDEDTQPWDSLFSNTIPASPTRRPPGCAPDFCPNDDSMDIDYPSYGGRVPCLASSTLYSPAPRIGSAEQSHADGMSQRMAGLYVSDHL